MPITRTPDPPFDDAPDHGTDDRSRRIDNGRNRPIFEYGLAWRKGDGSQACAACSHTIKGRRYQVKAIGLGGPWYHVACVTPDQWHRWLGPPRPETKRKPSQPGLRSQRGRKQLMQAILTPSFRFEPAPGWSP